MTGFAGLDEFDTEGIEALPSNEPNLERLAGYRADVVVSNTFVADYLGREVLEGLGGELVVVPDDHAERILALGDTFDRRSEAEAALADLDEAIAAGAATLNAGGRAVSVATVYPGSTVAAWVDGPIDVPATLLAMGFTLRPGATDVEGEEGGRLYLSNEQLDVLDADTLVALQSDLVAGEPEALEAMADDPLWSGLPAVAEREGGHHRPPRLSRHRRAAPPRRRPRRPVGVSERLSRSSTSRRVDGRGRTPGCRRCR